MGFITVATKTHIATSFQQLLPVSILHVFSSCKGKVPSNTWQPEECGMLEKAMKVAMWGQSGHWEVRRRAGETSGRQEGREALSTLITLRILAEAQPGMQR